MCKRIFSCVLCLVLVVVLGLVSVSAMGNVITASGGSASSVVVLTAEPVRLSYSTTTSLYCVDIAPFGLIMSDCWVHNQSVVPVLVESVTLIDDDKVEHTIYLNETLDKNSDINLKNAICSWFENNNIEYSGMYSLIFKVTYATH